MSKVKKIDANHLLERLLVVNLKETPDDDLLSLFEDLGDVVTILSEHKLNYNQSQVFQNLLKFKLPLETELFARNFMVPTSNLMFDMDEDDIYDNLNVMDMDGLVYTLEVWMEKSNLDERYDRLYAMACEELSDRAMSLSGESILPS